MILLSSNKKAKDFIKSMSRFHQIGLINYYKDEYVGFLKRRIGSLKPEAIKNFQKDIRRLTAKLNDRSRRDT